MDIVSQFEELKNAKKTQETLDGLNELLSVAKQEKDSSLALDISLQIVEVMRYLRMHDQVISWLEKELDSDFFTSKEDCLKIIDELIKTLLRTEDFLKLESVLFHRERFLTNDHQKVMQKFYFAVCYEGLKDYKKAIDTLKSIKDTISASNLVSKYLKLSMLYLKENDLSKAKENLDHAAKFDYRKTNPIFLLAESDILFFENDYLNSLVKYQEYFVKSKNKHRYLDRYILINIKLNKLDEAWRFYQEYMPSMSQVISKNYRLIFYEAGYLLAEALNNKEEQDKLRFLIDELEPIPPMLNQFDSVYRLLSIAFQNKVYKKPREIIHHLFKALDSLYKFQKMIYVVFDGDQALIYHYSKGLLLEKETHLLTLADSILGNILKTKPTNDLYGYDDLIKYSHHLYQTVETAYVFSDGIERRDAFDYFIVYSKEKSDFDIQQKLVLLATEILKKQMNDFDRYHDSDIVSRQITNLVDLSKDGLIKIENNTIHFLNQSAKEIFGMETDYLAFDVFQTYLEEIVFIDDFLNKESVSLKLKDSDKQLTFLLSEGEYTIYALVKEAKTDSLVQSINAFTNLPDERQLLMDNLNTESKTVMLIEIRNYLEHFSHYSHERYKERLDELTEFIRQTSKNHFDCIYLESYHLLYLTLKSIDKRVI
nr:hypothetical protein [Bacillota bacterium]